MKTKRTRKSSNNPARLAYSEHHCKTKGGTPTLLGGCSVEGLRESEWCVDVTFISARHLPFAAEASHTICFISLLRRSIVSRLNYQTTKGAKKHPALCRSAWLHSLFRWLVLPSMQSLDRTQLCCSAGELASLCKVAMPPFFFVKFHPVNNGPP